MLKLSLQKANSHTTFSDAFTIEEVDTALTATKSGKAAGIDGIYSEFLKNQGPNGRMWLAKLASNILDSGIIPEVWHHSKVVAILKPGKPDKDPKSYCPSVYGLQGSQKARPSPDKTGFRNCPPK